MKNLKYIFLIIAISGCNLFTTRTPESPDTGSNSEYRPPTTTDVLFQNFTKSYSSLNSTNYLLSYSPSQTLNLSNINFVFIPTSETQSSAGAVFDDWDINSEKRFFENYRNQISTNVLPSFQLIIQDSSLTSVSERQVSLSYKLISNYKPLSQLTGAPQICIGNARLLLIQSDAGTWYIKEWRDFKADSTFTLSELKRLLSN